MFSEVSVIDKFRHSVAMIGWSFSSSMTIKVSSGDTWICLFGGVNAKLGRSVGSIETPLVVSPFPATLATRRPVLDKLGVTGSSPVSPTFFNFRWGLDLGPLFYTKMQLKLSLVSWYSTTKRGAVSYAASKKRQSLVSSSPAFRPSEGPSRKRWTVPRALSWALRLTRKLGEVSSSTRRVFPGKW